MFIARGDDKGSEQKTMLFLNPAFTVEASGIEGLLSALLAAEQFSANAGVRIRSR